MALTDEGGSGIPATMLVGPATVGNGGMPYPVPMYGNSQSGNSGFGDGNGWWIILLFILIAAMGGNWGGNNGGNSGGMFGGGQPIVINDGGNSGAVQRGFDQAAVMAGLNGIQSGISGLSTQLCGCCGDISTQLCNGFNGVNTTVNSGVNALAQQMYANTIADLERSFAAQTANTQGMTALQSQLAQCCCDNRLATNDLKYTIATENCADRAAIADGIRDVMENCNRNNQAVLDKLCQLELDGKNDRIADLERQLTMANLAASQTAQTAAIRAGQIAEIDAMYNRLRDCPVPTMPVYGSQPIFQCSGPAWNNNGCGCGGNNF